jgi:hypothetical protein
MLGEVANAPNPTFTGMPAFDQLSEIGLRAESDGVHRMMAASRMGDAFGGGFRRNPRPGSLFAGHRWSTTRRQCQPPTR